MVGKSVGGFVERIRVSYWKELGFEKKVGGKKVGTYLERIWVLR